MHPVTPRTLDFTDHRRDLGDNRYVYAVVSRRAQGLSIGINLNPDKVCNFDCPYCQVDRTGPAAPPDVDVDVLADELGRLLGWVADGTLWETAPFDTAASHLRRVVDIAFAGDGEPTAARSFPAAVAAVREVRARHGLAFRGVQLADSWDGRGPAPSRNALPGDAGVPIRLLTNATLLHRAGVRAALGGIDEPWCKLDAGTESYFRVVDGTTFPFQRVLRNLRELACERAIVIQSMFLTLDGVGPDEAERDAWAARIGEIVEAGGRIDRVQVYSVARKPAQPRVGPLPREELERIGERVARLGVRVEVVG